MKKHRLILATAMLLALTACGNTDENTKNTYNGALQNIPFTSIQQNDTDATTTEIVPNDITVPDITTNYDIQTVQSDPLFVDIIDGKEVPVEVTFGRGGEDGYYTFSSKDPEVINGFIDALRQVEIKKVITDPEEMVYVCDANNDIHFIMEDGRQAFLAFELFSYVHDGNIEYELENTDELRNMYNTIREQSEPGTEYPD